ncbi:MAG TPA: DUF2865 domain-containing protein [Xanthobacteraceae bacterium]|nr:DUF2865 domain-containing protein [Xanthobacteraceae bacterium]
MVKARLALSVQAVALAAGLLLSEAVFAPAPAEAQNFFDMLGRIFRGAAPRAYQGEPPRLLERFPREGMPEQAPSGPGGPSVSYCVRLCDGRYFPLPRNANSDEQQICSAMCPAAQTKIFNGSQIDGAVANDGKRYSNMKNAFLYREKLVTNCTCNGRDPAGVAALDPLDDPTLRPGDVVVTAEGAKVFQGHRGGRKRANEFVPVEQARNLPKSMRQTLSDLRIAPERLTATAKSGTPATASVGAPANPALTMMPDGGETQLGNQPAAQN